MKVIVRPPTYNHGPGTATAAILCVGFGFLALLGTTFGVRPFLGGDSSTADNSLTAVVLSQPEVSPFSVVCNAALELEAVP